MISSNRISRIFILAGIISCSLLASACLNNNSDCVPSGNCTTVAPTTALLTLNVTIDSENPAVPVAVYFGDVSDSVLYFTDTLTSSVSYNVELNKKFSATAKYRRGNATIIAIDGDRTKLKTTNDCGDTCYQVTDASLQLKLKN